MDSVLRRQLLHLYLRYDHPCTEDCFQNTSGVPLDVELLEEAASSQVWDVIGQILTDDDDEALPQVWQ